MGRGRGKGGKNRKKGKNMQVGQKRELIFKEEGQEYAQALRMLGHGRLELWCFDGKKRMGHIRGTLKNRVWINPEDIVLVSLREFELDKCDVLLKYYPEEAKELIELKEIPENVKINEGEGEDSDEEEKSEDSDDEEEEEIVQKKLNKDEIDGI